jgi:hypothetical protein
MRMKEIMSIRGYFAFLINEGLKVKSLKDKRLEPSPAFYSRREEEKSRALGRFWEEHKGKSKFLIIVKIKSEIQVDSSIWR